MYAPCARSSLAKVCSTRFSLDVTFFALSFGTVEPQFVHWIVPDEPFPPFVRPLLARLSGMKIIKSASLYSCIIERMPPCILQTSGNESNSICIVLDLPCT